jgi:hypothetical protein
MEHDVVIITSEGEFFADPIGCLISRTIRSKKGRSLLAQAMSAPIRRNLDYQGMARRCLVVKPLPASALPFCDKDIDVTKTLSTELKSVKCEASEGGLATSQQFQHDVIIINSNNCIGPRSKLLIRKVTFPTFNICQSPSIKISDVKHRGFSLIDRAVQKTRAEVMAQEDANIFKALDNLVKK